MSHVSEDVTADADGLHFKVHVPAYDGNASPTPTKDSYLYLGRWRSGATAASLPINGSHEFRGTNETPTGSGGEGPYYGIAREDGDDLLWAFVHNTFYDDDRDLYVEAGDDDGRANGKRPKTDYKDIAEPPADPSGTVSATFAYTKAQRAEITKHIPQHVGWRDHTEGHRITTTRGDKIEVIGGNYKLICLGRGLGTVTTDWSGGHVVDTLEAQGNVTSINWRKIPSHDDEDAWQWVEETVKGNVIERFHGTHKEEFYGDKKVSIVGHGDEPLMEDVQDGSVNTGHWDEASEPWQQETNYWDSKAGSTDARLEKPILIEKVRARSTFEMEVYDHTEIDIDAPKGGSYQYLGCAPRGYKGFKADGSETSNVAEVVYYEPSGGDPGGKPNFDDASLKVDKVREFTHVRSKHDWLHADTWTEIIEVDDYKAEYAPRKGAPALTNATEYWRANHLETFIGTHTQLFAAAYTTVGLANRVECFVGAEWQLNLGLAVDLHLGFKIDVAAAKTLFTLDTTEADIKRLKVKVSRNLAAIHDLETTVADIDMAAIHSLM